MLQPNDRVFCMIFTVLLCHSVIVVPQSFGAGSELVCSDSVFALLGDDAILRCKLDPPLSASSETILWTKPGLDPKYIHVHRDGRLVYQSQNPSYQYRTGLFVDQLMNGNVSMKLSDVKLSDSGKYFCILESMQKEASVQLSVGAVSTPDIRLLGTDASRQVVLECKSKGWYPKPEVFWLDAEEKLLPAGPTETVTCPDGLYAVSSKVTVEKKHGNNFTCKIQQKDIVQTRQTHFYIPDTFFTTPSCFAWYCWVSIIVSIAVALFIFRPLKSILLFCYRWYWECVQERHEGERDVIHDVKEVVGIVKRIPSIFERPKFGGNAGEDQPMLKVHKKRDQPQDQPDQPQDQPDQPEDQPDQPEDQPDQPEDQPDQPEDQPDQPEDQPDQPDQPGDQPDQPGDSQINRRTSQINRGTSQSRFKSDPHN